MFFCWYWSLITLYRPQLIRNCLACIFWIVLLKILVRSMSDASLHFSLRWVNMNINRYLSISPLWFYLIHPSLCTNILTFSSRYSVRCTNKSTQVCAHLWDICLVLGQLCFHPLFYARLRLKRTLLRLQILNPFWLPCNLLNLRDQLMAYMLIQNIWKQGVSMNMQLFRA